MIYPMIKILVISAQTDLQPYLSGTRNRTTAFIVDYCRNLDSAMKKISETGGYHIVFADAAFISRYNSFFINQLIVQNAVSKVILIFDQPDMQQIRTYMNMGVYDFLLRPISGEDVRATLNKVIREIRMLSDVLTQHDQLVNIEQELEIARRIQESLLQRDYPYFPEHTAFDAYGQLVSSREVGGDFFDIFMLDPHRLGFVIGDVAGKGLPAALEMARIKVTMQGMAIQSDTAENCLLQLNLSMFVDQQPEMPVALFYGILNTSNGQLSYCNAGIPGPFHIVNHETMRILNGEVNPRLGENQDASYRAEHIRLTPGESLMLYSDGIVSSLGPQLEQIMDVLRSDHGTLNNFAVKTAVNNIVLRATRTQPSDDLTCLFLKYIGSNDPS